jgi:hypothetical protein
MNKNLTPFFPLSLKKEEGRDRKNTKIIDCGCFSFLSFHFSLQKPHPFLSPLLEKRRGEGSERCLDYWWRAIFISQRSLSSNKKITDCI